MRLVVGALFALVLLAPLASAAPGGADISTMRTLELRDALVAFHPDALFSAGPEWGGGSLSCGLLRITRFVSERAQGGNLEVPLGRAEASFTLTNATAHFDRVEDNAWLGVYPQEAIRVSTLAPAALLTIQGGHGEVVGNAPSTPEETPTPDRPSYSYGAPGQTLVSASHATIEASGPLMIKLSGSLIEISADENRTSLDTRTNASRLLTHERVWALLECSDGKLASAEPVSFTSLSRSVDVIETRLIEAHAHRGVVAIGAKEHDVRGHLYVRGDLSGQAVPLTENARALARIRLSGEIAATSISVGGTGKDTWWIWGAALVSGTALGAGGLALRRRRNPLTLEQQIQLAADSAELGHFTAAAEWIDQALQHAPAHPRLLADKAFYLAQAGDIAAALTTYRSAIDAGSIEARLLRARLLAEVGAEEDIIANALIEAVTAEPAFALEIDDEDSFVSVRARPDVRAALRAARRKLDS